MGHQGMHRSVVGFARTEEVLVHFLAVPQPGVFDVDLLS